MTVKIITDSTSYIDDNLVNELGIELLSLFVTFNDESIKEMDISNTDFYEKMEKEGIPISSQPSVGDMLLTMETILKEGNDIVAVFLSSSMSGTFNNAYLIAQELQDKYPDSKIKIIDSQTNSMQLGFAAIEGARLAKEGKSFEEVVGRVEDVVHSSRFIFIPENLDYLKKGGRIGAAETLIGNILKLTPILTVKDAETSVLRTVRTKKRAKAALIERLLEDHSKYEVQEIAIHHINCLEEAIELEKELKEKIDVQIHISSIGPVIGLHVGPGAIGLAYYTKNRIED